LLFFFVSTYSALKRAQGLLAAAADFKRRLQTRIIAKTKTKKAISRASVALAWSMSSSFAKNSSAALEAAQQPDADLCQAGSNY